MGAKDSLRPTVPLILRLLLLVRLYCTVLVVEEQLAIWLAVEYSKLDGRIRNQQLGRIRNRPLRYKYVEHARRHRATRQHMIAHAPTHSVRERPITLVTIQ